MSVSSDWLKHYIWPLVIGIITTVIGVILTVWLTASNQNPPAPLDHSAGYAGTGGGSNSTPNGIKEKLLGNWTSRFTGKTHRIEFVDNWKAFGKSKNTRGEATEPFAIDYMIDDNGMLALNHPTAKIALVKLTDSELVLSWNGEIRSYVRTWSWSDLPIIVCYLPFGAIAIGAAIAYFSRHNRKVYSWAIRATVFLGVSFGLSAVICLMTDSF